METQIQDPHPQTIDQVPHKLKSLEELLLNADLVTVKQLEVALHQQHKTKQKISDILVQEGLVTNDDLVKLCGLRLSIPTIDLGKHQISPEAMQLIPEKLAAQYDAIPLKIENNVLVMVIANPENTKAILAFEQQSMMRITLHLAAAEDIQKARALNYKSTSEIRDEISRIKTITSKKGEDDILSDGALAQTPVVRTVDLIIEQAVKDRASDIHIEPQPSRLRIRFRIDGILHDVMDLPTSVHPLLISRIKIIADMNIAERRRPQDGQFSIKVDGNDIDLRVATTDTAYGEKIVMRVLNKALSLMTLMDLGFQAEDYRKYLHIVKSPYGMVMICGPTGSGKTTTLYATVNTLDRLGTNIMTIEDPVEYKFTDISQTQTNEKAGVTFATGLKALMRLDPDVILIGETRDTETAAIATQAALTGHLMLTSIHANDAVGALFRLLYLGVEPFLVSSALIGTVAQRMVRRICPHCYTPIKPKPDELAIFEEATNARNVEFFTGTGCTFCAGTGYSGRIGVYEILPMSEGISQMLLASAPAPEIKAQAIKEGMKTMRQDAFTKVKDGVTSLNEALTKFPHE